MTEIPTEIPKKVSREWARRKVLMGINVAGTLTNLVLSYVAAHTAGNDFWVQPLIMLSASGGMGLLVQLDRIADFERKHEIGYAAPEKQPKPIIPAQPAPSLSVENSDRPITEVGKDTQPTKPKGIDSDVVRGTMDVPMKSGKHNRGEGPRDKRGG